MSVRYIDGFEDYATADITLGNWTANGGGGTPVISAGNGRNGASFRLAGSGPTAWLSKVLDAQATWVVGFAFRFVTPGLGVSYIVELLDAGSLQCELGININGTLAVSRLTSSVTGGTSTKALSANTWYYIEFKVTIANSIGAGTCKVNVNGVTWITVTTGQDLQATANATADTVKIGSMATNGPTTMDFDDLYILDGVAGDVAGDNDFLGDVRVDSLFPTGTGNADVWVTDDASTDNWEHTNDAAPDTATYVFSTTPNDIDTYLMGNIATTASKVWAVQTGLVVRKMDAGSRSIAPVLRGADGDKVGTTQSIGDSYFNYTQVYEQNPLTSPADWTETTVNSIEHGIKLIA